jgi:hypothetical protein
MTTIHAQAERKRQDRSVCRAEKRLCRARMLRVRGLIHPTSAVCATTDTARGEKRLPSEQNQAILKSSGRPLGECRLRRQAITPVKNGFTPGNGDVVSLHPYKSIQSLNTCPDSSQLDYLPIEKQFDLKFIAV